MKPGSTRTVVLGGLLFVSMTVVMVILAELVLRAVLPGSSRYLVHLAHTRRIFNPLPEFVPGVKDSAYFVTNAFGIRGPEFGADSAEYRVLALGGSTTECAVLDEPETWPAIMDAAMARARDGREVWIGNVGRSGLTSRDHVVEFRYLLPQLPRIDLIVVLAGINDLTSTLKQGFNYQPPLPITDPSAERQQVGRTFAVTPGPFHRPGTEFLLSQDAPWYKATALWQLAKRVRIRMTSNSLVQDPEGRNYELWRSHRRNPARLLDTLPDLGPALEEYTRNLNEIADLADSLGIRLVMLTQPTLWSEGMSDSARALLWMGGTGDFQARPGEDYFTPPRLRHALDRYNGAVLDVCARRHLGCLDLAAKVPADTRYFYDDVHFTEDGSRLVGQVVSAYLASVDSTLPPPRFDAPLVP